MAQSIVPQTIADEVRRLRGDVNRLARLGGYGANQVVGLPDGVVLEDTVQRMRNKTISGAENFLTNIPPSALPGSVVYADTTPVTPVEEEPTHDEDIAADILQFFPGMNDVNQQLVFGQSALGGHYRRQGNHVWFKIFFVAGVGFSGGSGTLSLQVPWTCPALYNQPLTLHFFQQTTAYGQVHLGGIAEFVQGTKKINLLLPLQHEFSNIGRVDAVFGGTPNAGTGYPVISVGSKLWVSGDVFVA